MAGIERRLKDSASRPMPQVITHDKCLLDCEDDLKRFVESMDLMDAKLGPLLFQFGYFNKTAFKSGKDFLARLEAFLKKLPKGYRFALEIRNKQWLTAEFFDLLRAHKVAYALIDQAWMPPAREIFEKFDPITADFTYIRLLGDRKGIEKQTKVWDKRYLSETLRLASRDGIAFRPDLHDLGVFHQCLSPDCLQHLIERRCGHCKELPRDI
jgi:uncharacterized protein YecE (DUF72 family)